MKTIIFLTLFLSGCTILPEVMPTSINANKINETNYMKTPCVLDGVTVKKKPKVSNIQ